MTGWLKKSSIAVAVALAATAVGYPAVTRVFVVSVRLAHLTDADMDVYRADRDRLLAIGADQFLLINQAEQVVLRLSALGHHYGPLLVWPRSSLKGVVLGDGVKGREAESYSFDSGGVTIRYQTGGHLQSVRVPFE